MCKLCNSDRTTLSKEYALTTHLHKDVVIITDYLGEGCCRACINSIEKHRQRGKSIDELLIKRLLHNALLTNKSAKLQYRNIQKRESKRRKNTVLEEVYCEMV